MSTGCFSITAVSVAVIPAQQSLNCCDSDNRNQNKTQSGSEDGYSLTPRTTPLLLRLRRQAPAADQHLAVSNRSDAEDLELLSLFCACYVDKATVCVLECREGALQSQQHWQSVIRTEEGNAINQVWETCMKPKSQSAECRGMSAAMQRSLLRLARQQAAVLAAGQRSYASAAELAVAQDSPYLRFASPEPHPITYGSLLGQIPETQAGGPPSLIAFNMSRGNRPKHGAQ